MLKRLAIVLFAWLGVSAAHASVSIYTYSGAPGPYAGWPAVSDPDNALGVPDGAVASVPVGGFIAYRADTLFNDFEFSIEFADVTGAANVRIYVGRVTTNGGFSSLNSQFFTAVAGINNFTSATLSSYCAGLGGCDAIVTQAWTGTTFTLDSVLAPNPEPAAWALMILAFGGVAARLKTLRRQGRIAPLSAPQLA